MRWLHVPFFFGLILPVHAADAPPVRLGLVVPTAAEAGPVAQSMRQAAETALTDWGPRLHQRVELRVKEDAFDPRKAGTSAEELVAEGVWGVVGHFYSSSSFAASAVYHAAGVPQVTPTATHPRLTAQGFDNVFRICGRDDAQGVIAAGFVRSRLHAHRIAIVHDRTEYGRGLVEAFRSELARGGARLVAEESLMQGDRDFAAQVARLKAARPDALYFGGVFREAGHLLRQLRQAGVHAAFIGGDAVLDPEFVRLAGEEAAADAYVTSAPDPRRAESARPVIQRYEARFGRLGPYVLYTYDGVGALLHAIQAVKPAGATPVELRKIVSGMRGRPYSGALGTLRWDQRGDRIPPPYAVYVAKRGGSVEGWFEELPSLALGGKAATGIPR